MEQASSHKRYESRRLIVSVLTIPWLIEHYAHGSKWGMLNDHSGRWYFQYNRGSDRFRLELRSVEASPQSSRTVYDHPYFHLIRTKAVSIKVFRLYSYCERDTLPCNVLSLVIATYELLTMLKNWEVSIWYVRDLDATIDVTPSIRTESVKHGSSFKWLSALDKFWGLKDADVICFGIEALKPRFCCPFLAETGFDGGGIVLATLAAAGCWTIVITMRPWHTTITIHTGSKWN